MVGVGLEAPAFSWTSLLDMLSNPQNNLAATSIVPCRRSALVPRGNRQPRLQRTSSDVRMR